MNLEVFEQMDAPELRNYIEFFLRRYRGPEYACRAMHEAEFVSFGQAVDPSFQVECRFAPPGLHPANADCQWRFYCEEKI